MDVSEQLFTTAIQLFQKYGFQRTTVNQICQHANLSRVTFYKHFKNKDELVIALLKIHIEKSNHMYELFSQSDISFEEKVRQLIKIKMEASRSFNTDLIKELMHTPRPSVVEFIHEQSQKQKNHLKTMFQQCRDKGEIRSDLNDDMIFFILEQLESWLRNPTFDQLVPDFEQKVSHIIQFFFFGVQYKQS